MNKDNDVLWDVNDRFPLNGFEYWDDDGDSIGDKGDIVDGVNDFALLYIYIYIIFLFLFFFLYHHPHFYNFFILLIHHIYK